MEVDCDHVHVVCSIPMTMPPTKALQLLKGYSAKILFVLVPNFRKRYKKGHFWSQEKFAASVGHITLEKAKQYLEAHHVKANFISISAVAGQGSPQADKESPSFRLGRMSIC